MKSQASQRSPLSWIKAIPVCVWGGGLVSVFVWQLFREAIEFYFLASESEDANGRRAPDRARTPSQALGKVGSLQAC